MGFGPRFCELVAILLSTASTRGRLRQGDPLSPSLFVLLMNTLNRVLAKAIELGILGRLARRELATSVSLYVDDVVIFCHPDETELRAIRSILELFRQASGLHTNFAK
jgi:hypothetical protein